MSFGTVVVVLFAIGCITAVKLHRQNRMGADHGRGAARSAHEAELERELEKLRQRIAVLERIATDEQRGQDLSREIESLRD